ncbi:MAG TPA: DUF1360 domain-containing protein [Acidimicrobiales bacterium]
MPTASHRARPSSRPGDGPHVVEELASAAHRVEERYSGGEDRHLGSYLGTMATYGAAVTAVAVAIRRRGVPLPERISGADLALLAVATHKVSRTVAKDAVTSPLRAPFTRYEGPAGAGELNEEVTATGALHGVGELLSCPFCLAQWVATAFVAGLVLAPRATRLVAGVFAARSGADVLQYVYAGLEQRLG